MTEKDITYSGDTITDITISVTHQDLKVIEHYINKDINSTYLPESVYCALLALVSSFRGRRAK